MTLQALFAFLITLPRRLDFPRDQVDAGIPRWERTPAEQQYLKQQEREDAARWLRNPRGY